MTIDEVLDTTPRYFAALVERHEGKRQREEQGRDWMLAQVIAMVANCGMIRFEDWRHPQEFMPTYGDASEAPKKKLSKRQREMNLDRQLERMMERAIAGQRERQKLGLEM